MGFCNVIASLAGMASELPLSKRFVELAWAAQLFWGKYVRQRYGSTRTGTDLQNSNRKWSSGVKFGAGLTANIPEDFEIRGARRRVLGILGLIVTSVLCTSVCTSVRPENPSIPLQQLKSDEPKPVCFGDQCLG